MIAVVVPTVRQATFGHWLFRWEGLSEVAQLYVIEDNPTRTINCGPSVRHYSWAEIDADLGDDAWIIPRRTDCVRSYGYLRAHCDGAEFTITLDDDVYPIDGMTPAAFVEAHVSRLRGEVESEGWTSTIGGATPRGVPYLNRARRSPCWLSHGLWQNFPDFDAPTQLQASRREMLWEGYDQTIPRGQYFPMCGMNLAWRRELTPAMWFLLMGPAYPFDRFGDIWAGIFAKRICDHFGAGVHSGEPSVWHARASNVWANLRKEAPGLEVNEELWRHVDAVRLTGATVAECYAELAAGLAIEGEYWDRLRAGMKLWSAMTDDHATALPARGNTHAVTP